MRDSYGRRGKLTTCFKSCNFVGWYVHWIWCFFILLFTPFFSGSLSVGKCLWWLKRTWKLKRVFIVTPIAMIKLEVILYLKWFRNFYHRDSHPTFVSANFYYDSMIFKYTPLLLIRHLSNINLIKNERISNKYSIFLCISFKTYSLNTIDLYSIYLSITRSVDIFVGYTIPWRIDFK